MQMNQLAFGADAHVADAHAEVCPYVPTNMDYCSASVMSVQINNPTRDNYCSSEDFDRCPLFLAKLLRRS